MLRGGLLAILVLGGLAVGTSFLLPEGERRRGPQGDVRYGSAERPEKRRRAPYRTPRGDVYTNAKTLSGRIAERLTTYAPGTSVQTLTARLPASVRGTRGLRQRLGPLADAASGSRGKVVYPQLGGVTPTAASVMVVVRQRRLRPGGTETTETRTIDVRLRRAGGPWRVADVASVGGRPVARPESLSTAARAVLDNDRIELPDSARWDIHRGGVDERLLRRMNKMAERVPYAVAVLDTGHPMSVFETDRRSAHSSGYAVDVWKVGGRRVVRQRRPGSPAFVLARSLLAGGATQLGSPWALGKGSFTDVVHQDHLHLQQTPVS